MVDAELLILVGGGVLCVEALMPLLAPAWWKRVISGALRAADPQLRVLGGVLSVCGCLLLLTVPPVPLAIAGSLLLVEGLPMLLSPGTWSSVMRSALALRDGQLRFLGLLGFGVGLLLLGWSWLG
jgi:uncharacterized protein YjeT (DUF2065 family)